MNIKAKITEVLGYESSKKDWRNNHSSKEYKEAEKLGKTVGSPLNKSVNCACLEDLFIVIKLMSKDKIELKQIQMESSYKLKKNVIIWLPSQSLHVTNDNLTDEIGEAILKAFPAHKVSFETMPEAKAVSSEKTDDKKVESKEGGNSLREKADKIAADTKGLSKAHWKSSDETLKEYIAENSK